jgi:hypothetical protein
MSSGKDQADSGLAVPVEASHLADPATTTGVAFLILAVFFAGFWLGVAAMVAIRDQERGSAVLPVRCRARRGGPRRRDFSPGLAAQVPITGHAAGYGMNGTVVAIVNAFFVIGILVGIIATIAISVLRAERRDDPADLLDYEPRERPSLPWDDTGPNRRPRWPEDADNDFSGR